MSGTSVTRRDVTTLVDMQRACRDIVVETGAVELELFLADERSQAFILHRLIILGEATKRLSTSLRIRHSDIAWREIAGTRDVLIHNYDGVNLDRVWATAVNDIPPLLRQIEALVRLYASEAPESGRVAK